MDDFEGFKISVEKEAVYMLEISRELEVEPKDVTELLQSHDTIQMGEELLPMDEQRKQFFKMESTPA